jgi:membrane protein DedA with SNARE-associated domain
LHFSFIYLVLYFTYGSWISTYGYPGAFFAALLETIFPPIPSELIFWMEALNSSMLQAKDNTKIITEDMIRNLAALPI